MPLLGILVLVGLLIFLGLSNCVYQTLCPVCLNEEPQIAALNSLTLRQESSQSALWNDLVFFQLLHERVGVLFSQFLEVL